MLKKHIIILFLSIFFIGCSAYMHINSEIDYRFNFPEKCRVYLILANDATILEKNFYYELKDELTTAPFILEDNPDSADFAIIFGVNKNVQYYNYYLPIPTVTETKGAIDKNASLDRYTYSEKTTSTTWLGFTATKNKNAIWLSMHEISKLKDSVITPVWQAQASVNKHQYDELTNYCAQWLLSTYGTEIDDQVKIERKKENQLKYIDRWKTH